jgi:hypothetical protein
MLTLSSDVRASRSSAGSGAPSSCRSIVNVVTLLLSSQNALVREKTSSNDHCEWGQLDKALFAKISVQENGFE